MILVLLSFRTILYSFYLLNFNHKFFLSFIQVPSNQSLYYFSLTFTRPSQEVDTHQNGTVQDESNKEKCIRSIDFYMTYDVDSPTIYISGTFCVPTVYILFHQ